MNQLTGFTKGYVVWCENGSRIANVYIEAIETLSPPLAVAQAESSLGDGWQAKSYKRLRGRVSAPEKAGAGRNE